MFLSKCGSTQSSSMAVDTTEGLPAVCSQEEHPSVCSAAVNAATSCMQVSLLEPPKKVCKIDDETIDDTTTELWLQLDKACLTSIDKFVLSSGARLNDHHINYAQSFLGNKMHHCKVYN